MALIIILFLAVICQAQSHVGMIFAGYADCSATHDPNADYSGLSRYGAFWSAQTIEARQPEVFRRLGADGKLLFYYVTPLLARHGAPSSYLDYAYIEAKHPEWFLLQSPGGERIRYAPNDPPGSLWHDCFFLDVGNPEFQRWAIGSFVQLLAKHPGYCGLLCDNGLFDVWANGKTKAYPSWKYADGGWDAAYFGYLSRLHEALSAYGYLMVVNQTADYGSDDAAWSGVMRIADGLADEQALGPPWPLWSGDRWETSLRQHEAILAAGQIDWWVPQPSDADEFLYIYASFLLVRDSGSYFGCVNQSWYPEYAFDLGRPCDVRHRRDWTWYREFENAWVFVNPYGEPHAMSIDPVWQQSGKNSFVERGRVYLQPKSAMIVEKKGI